MMDFLATIGHAKKLNKALKDNSIEQIEALIVKLELIVNKRKEVELAQTELAKVKANKIVELQKIMLECDISANELLETKDISPRIKRQPRAAKYAIEVNGELITWTGQGRMPNVFKNAIGTIDKYLIK